MTKYVVFNAYVLSSIGDNRLCMRIDPEFVPRISSLYSEIFSKDIIRDIITVNVKNAQFTISTPWTDLDSLVGTHIRVNANSRQYFFWDTKDRIQEDGSIRQITVQRKGITFRATSVKSAD